LLLRLSVDEKLGAKASQNIAPALPPKPAKSKSVSCGFEYKRLVICSGRNDETGIGRLV
jgi:hypothetical protein